MAQVELDQVSKQFQQTTVVDKVSLSIADGEFIALLGPSGCGKTTVLRMIAGLETVSHGQIKFAGKTVSGRGYHQVPEQRNVGIVFQSYALWPHMSVARNVGYPLEAAGIRGERYQHRVSEVLKSVGLHDFAERRPAQLSGGQQQRVALARCLAMQASVVLLDEPLANLDVHLRATMEEEFLNFHQNTGATMLYVTHDQAEAMALANRIAVMDQGRLVQVDTPQALYRQPATTMVAEFIGKGVVVSGEVVTVDGSGHCAVDLFGSRWRLRCQTRQTPGPAKISLRPEQLCCADSGIRAKVHRCIYRGASSTLEIVPITDQTSTLLLELEQPPAPDTIVHLRIEDGWVIPEDDPNDTHDTLTS